VNVYFRSVRERDKGSSQVLEAIFTKTDGAGSDMTFSVRQARIDDLETLVSFTTWEAREAEGLEINENIIREGIRAGIENPAMATYWVLESEDCEIVGSVSVVKEWSDWNAAYYHWIQSMFIVEEYRGQGLMRVLVDAVRSQARKENGLEIRLYVHKDNKRARKAYRRDGFSDAPYQVMTMKL
jgi:GNAT superfamily N-acetyltransferase